MCDGEEEGMNLTHIPHTHGEAMGRKDEEGDMDNVIEILSVGALTKVVKHLFNVRVHVGARKAGGVCDGEGVDCAVVAWEDTTAKAHPRKQQGMVSSEPSQETETQGCTHPTHNRHTICNN